jgi:RNA-directed DNA polymerase
MTVKKLMGAPSANEERDWKTINWQNAQSKVKRLQMRIAKAVKEKRHGKARALQWVLTHSFYAKLLAVKRVTGNSGAKTPGIDGVIWKTAAQKLQAVSCLKHNGIKTQPLRRIYIPKKNGQKRPLGIPTMIDRAHQALHLLALEPIAETTADINSYGFRPKRRTADALEQCFIVLARKVSAQWVLEGDIKACFDTISHQWLLEHTPMDKKVLEQWLKAGFVHNNEWFPSDSGAAQGGSASPTIANLALDGIEPLIKSLSRKQDKAHFVRYADDFIITGNSKEFLEEKVKPALKNFLATRGSNLSDEKTRITHIDEGFDFLGFNVRKYNGKLLIKPSKKNTKAVLDKVRDIIKTRKGATTDELIKTLNPIIRGWANYHQHVVSKQTFSYVDSHIFNSIWQWCCRRHPNKNRRWIKNKYFASIGNRNWVFSATYKNHDGERKTNNLIKAVHVPIRRHIKIRAVATPYDKEYQAYFAARARRNKSSDYNESNHIDSIGNNTTKYTPSQPLGHVKMAS